MDRSDSPKKAKITSIREDVDTAPLEQEGADHAGNLRQSAQQVEDTAYDLAGKMNSEFISQLIVIASDLERLATFLERNKKL